MSNSDCLSSGSGNNRCLLSRFESGKAIYCAGSASLVLFVLSFYFALTGVVIAMALLFAAALFFGIISFILMSRIVRKAGNSFSELMGMSIDHGEIISGFSHSIREPLNNLVIIAELLSDTNLSEKQKDMIETLIASTTNMVSTLDELSMKTAAAIDPGQRKPIKFNLLSAIQSTLDLFNLRSDKGIATSLSSDLQEAPEVIGDPIIIKQIIIDVLNTLSGDDDEIKPWLSININKLSGTGDKLMVNLTVTANKSFIQHEERSGNNHSLLLRLIRAGGGRYEYRMSDNEALLTLCMPFKSPASSESSTHFASRKLVELEKDASSKKELKELNILLVEDNPINQKITFLTLKPLVKSIDTASNGKEALDKIATADYDIILMDIQMPVMDGLVAAEKIRALEKGTGRHVPIVAITANAMLGDKERCVSAGMDDYISKPFNPATLLAKISQFFQGSQER